MDPFAAFGETEPAGLVVPEKQEQNVLREASCGVLSHHEGVEAALLQFVRQQLLLTAANGPAPGGLTDDSESGGGTTTGTVVSGRESATSTMDRIAQILTHVDQFCRMRHWMMHIGDEKGLILDKFLGESLEAWSSSLTRPSPPSAAEATGSSSDAVFLILEVGSYCGYSLLRMAKTCLQHLPSRNFRIVTCDVSPIYQSIAKEMIRLAGLENIVDFVLLPSETEASSLSQVVSDIVQTYRPNEVKVDFVFLDHDKDLYYPDLCDLEQSRLIRAGTRVCADNVVFFRLQNYQNHMKQLATAGTVTTQLKLSRLEYVNDNNDEAKGKDLTDGLGKSQSLLV